MASRYGKFVQDLDDHAPSTADYLRALRLVWSKRPDPSQDLRMLREQVLRGGRITSTEMCYALGYSDVPVANGRYGRLGHAVADALQIRSRTGGQWYLTISGNGGLRHEDEGPGRFIWELRPEFEEALKRFPETATIFCNRPKTLPAQPPDEEPSQEVKAAIQADFEEAAEEGDDTEQQRRDRIRAAWLAEVFVRGRNSRGDLKCDDCRFDPTKRAADAGISARTLMDVHHRDPLAEGRRVTTMADFELLCPNCHRLRHAVMRAKTRR